MNSASVRPSISAKHKQIMRPIHFSLATLAVLALVSATAAEFNVREHGAKGDGQTIDTIAIQKALEACGKAGGGTVRFPAGTYLSKPLTLRTKTTVQLDEGAVLLAT